MLQVQDGLCFTSNLQLQVKELTEQFPAATPLALVLKQFLADRSLDQSYSGGLSSYCLVRYAYIYFFGSLYPTDESWTAWQLAIYDFKVDGSWNFWIMFS